MTNAIKAIHEIGYDALFDQTTYRENMWALYAALSEYNPRMAELLVDLVDGVPLKEFYEQQVRSKFSLSALSARSHILHGIMCLNVTREDTCISSDFFVQLLEKWINYGASGCLDYMEEKAAESSSRPNEYKCRELLKKLMVEDRVLSRRRQSNTSVFAEDGSVQRVLFIVTSDFFDSRLKEKHYSLCLLLRAKEHRSNWFALHFDSLGRYHETRFRDVFSKLRKLFEYIAPNVHLDVYDWHLNYKYGYPQMNRQQNGWACGYFVCAIAKLFTDDTFSGHFEDADVLSLFSQLEVCTRDISIAKFLRRSMRQLHLAYMKNLLTSDISCFLKYAYSE